MKFYFSVYAYLAIILYTIHTSEALNCETSQDSDDEDILTCEINDGYCYKVTFDRAGETYSLKGCMSSLDPVAADMNCAENELCVLGKHPSLSDASSSISGACCCYSEMCNADPEAPKSSGSGSGEVAGKDHHNNL